MHQFYASSKLPDLGYAMLISSFRSALSNQALFSSTQSTGKTSALLNVSGGKSIFLHLHEPHEKYGHVAQHCRLDIYQFIKGLQMYTGIGYMQQRLECRKVFDQQKNSNENS
jgi:hypothetical protein